MPIEDAMIRHCLRVIDETTAQIAGQPKHMAQFNSGVVTGIAGALLYIEAIDSLAYDRITGKALGEAARAIGAEVPKA